MIALMGPNGAGKSTLLQTLFGLAPIASGTIVWKGKTMHPRPHEVIREGIVFVPQGRRIFASLSVVENLEIGGWTRSKADATKRAAELMELFPILREKRSAPAGTLSGGQQQILAIARGLMVEPTLLLLDEPTLGLSPKMVAEIFETIKTIHENLATTMLIVEHNIKTLLSIANRAVILDKGRIVIDDHDIEKLKTGDVLGKILLGS